MHEMAIAQGIVEIALQTARDHEAERILGIKVQIGRMTGVVPDSLRFCFDALTAGTLAEGAVLTIETPGFTIRCWDCGGRFAAEQFVAVCPECGSMSIEILSGRELRVEHVEVE